MENLHALFWPGDIENYYPGHQFEEIFKSRLYAPYLENKPDAKVLDLGANLGTFSLYASKYASQIWSLEPDPENFNAFSYMVAFNHLDNVKPIQKAIFIENGMFPFHQNLNKTMKSLHGAIDDGSSEAPQVEAITLDKLFEDEGIEHIDLMKLDIEGTEAELLASEGFSKVASKISVIVGERHSWNGRHPNQLNEALKNNGFKVTTLPNDADIFVATK